MKHFEEYTLEDIVVQQDKRLYELYNKEIINMQTNRISKYIVQEMYGSSLLNIALEVEKKEEENRSLDLFPGDLVLLHLGLKELKSRNFITCDFSGAIIRPKQLYINYRPLVENLTTGNVYVLKRTIKTEIAYEYYLPRNIKQLEQINEKIKLGIDEDSINYGHIRKELGEMELQKFKRR